MAFFKVGEVGYFDLSSFWGKSICIYNGNTGDNYINIGFIYENENKIHRFNIYKYSLKQYLYCYNKHL
jgi:hypothetical protein